MLSAGGLGLLGRKLPKAWGGTSVSPGSVATQLGRDAHRTLQAGQGLGGMRVHCSRRVPGPVLGTHGEALRRSSHRPMRGQRQGGAFRAPRREESWCMGATDPHCSLACPAPSLPRLLGLRPGSPSSGSPPGQSFYTGRGPSPTPPRNASPQHVTLQCQVLRLALPHGQDITASALRASPDPAFSTWCTVVDKVTLVGRVFTNRRGTWLPDLKGEL